jgi:hypothetical protein
VEKPLHVSGGKSFQIVIIKASDYPEVLEGI